jgi:hypothetical protein
VEPAWRTPEPTVWWTNLEFIHHMAEIALLRDLWQARST